MNDSQIIRVQTRRPHQRSRRRPFWFWALATVGALALMVLALLGGYQLYLFRNGDGLTGNLALGNPTTPTVQAVATFTPTPLSRASEGATQAATLPVAATAVPVDTVPLNTEATSAELAAPVGEARANRGGAGGSCTRRADPCATPRGAATAVPPQRTITLDDIAPNADQSPPPTPAPPTATPTVPPAAVDQLTQAIQLHRMGDYVAARSRLATLINDPATTQEVRQDALFTLPKAIWPMAIIPKRWLCLTSLMPNLSPPPPVNSHTHLALTAKSRPICCVAWS